MTKITRDNDPGPDGKGAVEEDIQRIESIKGSETLGYKGEAHEEHSGQKTPRENPDPKADLADNRPQDISIKKD